MKQLQIKIYGTWHNVSYFSSSEIDRNIISDARWGDVEETPIPIDNKPEKIKLPPIKVIYTDGNATEHQLSRWMQQVTDWINNH